MCRCGPLEFEQHRSASSPPLWPHHKQDEVLEVPKDPRAVFVVFGRNEALRASMFSFLRSIGLKPMEWSHAIELTGHGSPYIGDILDVAFDHAQAIVVLLTPDEVAYLHPRYAHPGDPETQPATQPRPNVLFEAGMALGRSPERTMLVEVGDLRSFSDVAGRHAIRLNNSVAKRQDLAQRLKTAGCDVDLAGTDWHSSGDFAAPDSPGGELPLGRRVPSVSHLRPTVEFDLKYHRTSGNSRLDKLQVINRGLGTVYDVTLSVPDNAALDLQRVDEIPKIPGGGKSVTVHVLNFGAPLGGDKVSVFDVTVSGRTEDGEAVSQDVFLDVNG